MTYADSSFIASVYSPDCNTAVARDFVEKNLPRLPFIFLHWPEVAKAIWKNSELPGQIWDRQKKDIAEEKFHSPDLNAESIARRAAGLIIHFSPRWKKIRSLDAMHISAAVEGGFKTFLSFDTQSFQRVLAASQKLKVWPPLTKEELAHLK
jgi:predicted nucleic acid-binding protein